MPKKNYVISYYKKTNKSESFYDVKADTLNEVRALACSMLKQEPIQNLASISKLKGKKPIISLPNETRIINIYHDGFEKMASIGSVIIVPGMGTWWVRKKNGKTVFYPLNYNGKIGRKPVSKFW